MADARSLGQEAFRSASEEELFAPATNLNVDFSQSSPELEQFRSIEKAPEAPANLAGDAMDIQRELFRKRFIKAPEQTRSVLPQLDVAKEKAQRADRRMQINVLYSKLADVRDGSQDAQEKIQAKQTMDWLSNVQGFYEKQYAQDPIEANSFLQKMVYGAAESIIPMGRAALSGVIKEAVADVAIGAGLAVAGTLIPEPTTTVGGIAAGGARVMRAANSLVKGWKRVKAARTMSKNAQRAFMAANFVKHRAAILSGTWDTFGRAKYGEMYRENEQNGMNPEINSKYSKMGGFAEGVIESLISPVDIVTGGNALPKIASQTFRKIFRKNVRKAAAANLAGRLALRQVGEQSEEGAQQIAGNVIQFGAEKAQSEKDWAQAVIDGVEKDINNPDNMVLDGWDVVRDGFEAFKESFWAVAGLGAFGLAGDVSIGQYAQDRKAAGQIEEAEGREDFTQELGDAAFEGSESIPEQAAALTQSVGAAETERVGAEIARDEAANAAEAEAAAANRALVISEVKEAYTGAETDEELKAVAEQLGLTTTNKDRKAKVEEALGITPEESEARDTERASILSANALEIAQQVAGEYKLGDIAEVSKSALKTIKKLVVEMMVGEGASVADARAAFDAATAKEPVIPPTARESVEALAQQEAQKEAARVKAENDKMDAAERNERIAADIRKGWAGVPSEADIDRIIAYFNEVAGEMVYNPKMRNGTKANSRQAFIRMIWGNQTVKSERAPANPDFLRQRTEALTLAKEWGVENPEQYTSEELADIIKKAQAPVAPDAVIPPARTAPQLGEGQSSTIEGETVDNQVPADLPENMAPLWSTAQRLVKERIAALRQKPLQLTERAADVEIVKAGYEAGLDEETLDKFIASQREIDYTQEEASQEASQAEVKSIDGQEVDPVVEEISRNQESGIDEVSNESVSAYTTMTSSESSKKYGSLGSIRKILTGTLGKEILAKLPDGVDVEVRVGIVGPEEIAITQPSTASRGPRVIISSDVAAVLAETDTDRIDIALAELLAHEVTHAVNEATGGDFADEFAPTAAELRMREKLRPKPETADVPDRAKLEKSKAPKALVDFVGEQRLQRMPSQAKIMKATGLGLQEVLAGLDILESEGHIKKDASGKRKYLVAGNITETNVEAGKEAKKAKKQAEKASSAEADIETVKAVILSPEIEALIDAQRIAKLDNTNEVKTLKDDIARIGKELKAARQTKKKTDVPRLTRQLAERAAALNAFEKVDVDVPVITVGEFKETVRVALGREKLTKTEFKTLVRKAGEGINNPVRIPNEADGWLDMPIQVGIPDSSRNVVEEPQIEGVGSKSSLEDLNVEQEPSKGTPQAKIEAEAESVQASSDRLAALAKELKTETDEARIEAIKNEMKDIAFKEGWRYQPSADGKALTKEQATKQIASLAAKTNGTFTVSRDSSNNIGTLKIGSMTVRYMYAPTSREAAGEIKQDKTNKASYTVLIDPQNGNVTTVSHEAAHIVRDVLFAPERAAIKALGFDLSNIEGEEAFARKMETEEGRKEIGKAVRALPPAKQSIVVRAFNKIIRAINAVFGTDIAPRSTKELKAFAEGLEDFSILTGRSPLEALTQDARAQARDVEYAAAVESGDTETQQRLVDEAAERAGFTQKAYHGTASEFTEFDLSRVGDRDIGYFGPGFYFSNSESFAKGYGDVAVGRVGGGIVLDARLRMRNPYITAPSAYAADRGDLSPAEFTEELKSQGYDGLVVQQPSGKFEYVAFSPNQIKSADPVTRDDQGNVIPLSRRFDQQQQDIRFQEKAETREERQAEPETIKAAGSQLMRPFAQATAQIRSIAKATNGTFTESKDSSNKIGTLKIGGMTIDYVYAAPSKEASGEIRQDKTNKASYTVLIDPQNGQVTTIRHEAAHIVRDVLFAPERAAIKAATGFDLDTLEGDEAFARQMETAAGRNELSAQIKALPAAKQGIILRAINKVIAFVNAVTGAKFARIGSADALATGLNDFSILTGRSPLDAQTQDSRLMAKILRVFRGSVQEAGGSNVGATIGSGMYVTSNLDDTSRLAAVDYAGGKFTPGMAGVINSFDLDLDGADILDVAETYDLDELANNKNLSPWFRERLRSWRRKGWYSKGLKGSALINLVQAPPPGFGKKRDIGEAGFDAAVSFNEDGTIHEAAITNKKIIEDIGESRTTGGVIEDKDALLRDASRFQEKAETREERQAEPETIKAALAQAEAFKAPKTDARDRPIAGNKLLKTIRDAGSQIMRPFAQAKALGIQESYRVISRKATNQAGKLKAEFKRWIDPAHKARAKRIANGKDVTLSVRSGGEIKDGGDTARTIKLSRGEALTYYLLNLRAQAEAKIQGREGQAKRLNKAMERIVLEKTASGDKKSVFHLTPQERARFMSEMGRDADIVAETKAIEEMMNFSYGLVNAQYKDIWGKDLDRDAFYFRMVRDVSFLKEKIKEGDVDKNTFDMFDPDKNGLLTISPESMSSLQNVEWSDAPLIIRDAFDQTSQHIQQVEGYLEGSPIKGWIDANILNKEVRDALGQTPDGIRQLEYWQSQSDNAGGQIIRHRTAIATGVNAFLKNATPVRLANPAVWAKQVMSMPSAIVNFGHNPKYLLDMIGPRNKKLIDAVRARSGTLEGRASGRQLDPLLPDFSGEGSGAAITGVHKTKLATARAKSATFVQKMMGGMDKVAIDGIIMGAAAYVRDTQPNLTGEAFEQEVADQAATAVKETQVATFGTDRTTMEQNVRDPFQGMVTYMWGARGAQLNVLVDAVRTAVNTKSPEAYRNAAVAIMMAGVAQSAGVVLVNEIKEKLPALLKGDKEPDEEDFNKAYSNMLKVFESIVGTVPILGTEGAPAIFGPLFKKIGDDKSAALRRFRLGKTGPLAGVYGDVEAMVKWALDMNKTADALEKATTRKQRTKALADGERRSSRTRRAAIRVLSETTGIPANQIYKILMDYKPE